MSRLLAPLIAATVILTSGLAQGVWNGRWSNSHELEASIAKLERVPMVIGDWEGHASTLDTKTLEAAEISGYVARRYKNRRDGRVVTILLVCGRPGPISVHTPEVCYAGNGFEPKSPAVKRSFGDNGLGPNEFWVLNLEKHISVLSEALRINYSWSVGRNWVASDSPRMDFAGSPALYKLYVIRAIASDAEGGRDGLDTDFEQEVLPVLRTAILAES